MSRIVSQSRETLARRVRVLPLKSSARRCDPKAQFVLYSEAAMKAIKLGQEEVRRLGHECLGMEQLLLGLIREGTGIAAKVLISMGINLKDARVEVEKIIGRGSTVADSIPYNPDFTLLLRHSREEADNRGQNYVGSGHLLLGLLRDEEGVATGILTNLGTDPSNIRAQVIRMVGEVTESVASCIFTKRPRREYTTNTTEMAEVGKST